MMIKCCAFVDLVGTKHLADLDPESYEKSLTKFQGILKESSTFLRGKGRAFSFSDCAFVSSDDANALLTFLTYLRSKLLLEGYYFKGAVDSGVLDVFPKEEDEPDTERFPLSATYFGTSAARLVGMESSLKGIGYNVSDRFFNSVGKRQQRRLISSCYVGSTGPAKCSYYRDIALANDDIRFRNFERLARALMEAKTHSRTVGRRYVSALVTLIKSLDLSQFGSEDFGNTEEGKILNTIFGNAFYKGFSDVTGIEYAYLAAYDRLLEHKAHFSEADWKKSKPYMFLCRHKRLLSSLDCVPPQVLSPAARMKLIEDVSDDYLGKRLSVDVPKTEPSAAS